MCDYSTFLPDVVGMMFQKDVTQKSITESEVKALVAVAFRSTVNKFARDTRTLRQQIPIHLFENSRYYDLTPEGDFYIHEIEQIYENKIPFPPGVLVNQRSIHLAECPPSDMDNAWIAEVSVIPGGLVCVLDDEYCFRHYEAILQGIIYRLASQKARTYYDQDLADRALSLYNQQVRVAERELMNLLSTDTGAAKFFPAILNTLVRESPSARNIRNHELMSIITTAYRDTVADTAAQNLLMHRQISISLLRGTNYYPLDAGIDVTISKVVSTLGINASVPEGTTVTKEALTLPCCVTRDVDNAFQVTVAVAPKRTVCSFDEEFVDKHYETILAGIRYRLAIQGGAEWASLGRYQVLKQEYNKRLMESRRSDIGLNLKLNRARLTDDH